MSKLHLLISTTSVSDDATIEILRGEDSEIVRLPTPAGQTTLHVENADSVKIEPSTTNDAAS